MIFIDTGAFIARYIAKDVHHKRAVVTWERIIQEGPELSTSIYVLAEVATLLRVRADAAFVRTVVADLFGSRRLLKLRPSLDDEARALQWFDRVPSAGFVDALSFSLMKSNRITRAFTFDSDFRAAGFEVFP